MQIYQGVILGALQGVTEFLPVSSSGHLVLGQYFFGITEPTLFFDVSLHVGTLAAVCLVFYRDILSILNALWRFVFKRTPDKNHSQNFNDETYVRFALMIIIGSVPTAVIGLVFKKYTDILFSSILLVGCMLMVTGTLLWFTRKSLNRQEAKGIVSVKQALFIGVCQGLAILPGISRSGSTIAAGLFSGVERETAAKFSFLLSIPAIFGAELLSLKDLAGTTGIVLEPATVYGTLAAFVVGYAALMILMGIVRQGRLHLFSPYCWAVGVAAIAAGLIL